MLWKTPHLIYNDFLVDPGSFLRYEDAVFFRLKLNQTAIRSTEVV